MAIISINIKQGIPMEEWISVKDLANGYKNLPKLSIMTQAHLRSRKKLKYTKIAKNVFYLESWIVSYINSNIREAKTSQKDNENE